VDQGSEQQRGLQQQQGVHLPASATGVLLHSYDICADIVAYTRPNSEPNAITLSLANANPDRSTDAFAIAGANAIANA
jgi:hypothetical protein